MILLALLFPAAIAAAVLWAAKPFKTADWVFVWAVLVVSIAAKFWINYSNAY
jgi:hypothetical protein